MGKLRKLVEEEEGIEGGQIVSEGEEEEEKRYD